MFLAGIKYDPNEASKLCNGAWNYTSHETLNFVKNYQSTSVTKATVIRLACMLYASGMLTNCFLVQNTNTTTNASCLTSLANFGDEMKSTIFLQMCMHTHMVGGLPSSYIVKEGNVGLEMNTTQR